MPARAGGSPVGSARDALRFVVHDSALLTASILLGILVFLATLYTGYWSTFAYFSAIGPIICWHIDGWLGFADRRVAWPTDPVGRLTEVIDRRWPPRDAQALEDERAGAGA